MRRPDLILGLALLAAMAVPTLVLAEGHVTKYLRDELQIYDEAGAPLGMVKASALPRNPAVVKLGKGNTIGIMQGQRLIFLRPIQVNTEGVGAQCKTVQVATRAAGSALASQSMGVGSAKDCRPQPAAAGK
jgi:hypothetical protein